MTTVLDQSFAAARQLKPNLWSFDHAVGIASPCESDRLRKELADFSRNAQRKFFGQIPLHGVYDHLHLTSPFYNGGWQLFLNYSEKPKALVLEADIASCSIALSRLAADVWTVFENPNFAESAASRASEEGLTNVNVVSTSVTGRLPFHEGVFDLIALRGLGGELPVTNSFSGLISELRRVLKPTGFLALDGRGFFPLLVGFRLWLAGFEFPELLVHMEDVQKIPYETRSAFQSRSLVKRLKSLVFTAQRFRHFGLITRKKGASSSTNILNRIAAELPTPVTGKRRTISEIFYGSFDIYGFLTEDLVVRMPIDQEGRAHCENNARQLTALEKINFSFQMPKFVKRGEIQGQAFFVETRIPGKPAPYLTYSNEESVDVNRSAQACLEDLYAKTRRNVLLDDAQLDRLFVEPMRVMEQYLNEDAKSALRMLGRTLCERLKGRSIDLVQSHGDFKTANFLLDDQGKVGGVIDWDMSESDTLPLIDLIACEGFEISAQEKKLVPLGIFEVGFVRMDKFLKNLSPGLSAYVDSGVGLSTVALSALLKYFLRLPVPELRVNKEWENLASGCILKACEKITAEK